MLKYGGESIDHGCIRYGRVVIVSFSISVEAISSLRWPEFGS